jgi:hypothetical protein
VAATAYGQGIARASDPREHAGVRDETMERATFPPILVALVLAAAPAMTADLTGAPTVIDGDTL